MRFFFRSRQFKVIVSIVALLVAISVLCAIIGGTISPQSNIIGSVTAPFRSFATRISTGITEFFDSYRDGEKMALENADLESELADLREKNAEYEKAIAENEFYKDYLDIKDKNPSFQFAPATIISRDKEDPYKGFVINKGTAHGISANDPVIINEKHLVGIVSEVGLTTSKVVTVLSSEVTAGALDNRTNDSGILSGSIELAALSKTKLYNLSRSCNIAVGDYVVTSGEGIFPAGLLIGTIETIGSDKYNTSIYANVNPFVNFDELKSVMVITSFDGQGGMMPEDKQR